MKIFRLLSPQELDRYIEKPESKAGKIEGAMAAGAENLSFESSAEDQTQLKHEKEDKSKFPKDHQAKIIPINELKNRELKEFSSKEESIAIENEEEKAGEEESQSKQKNDFKHSTGSSLESVGILSASSLREIEEQRLQDEMRDRESTTAFLINERNKMRTSKKRLIEQQAYKTYKATADQEFSHTEELLEEDEDESSSVNKGILVNKKHY